MSEPQPGNSILQRLDWRAVLLGFATDFGGTKVMSLGVGFCIGVFMAAQGHDVSKEVAALMTSSRFLLIMGAMGSLFTVAGGFVVARFAPRAPYLNATALGVADIVLGFIEAHAGPAWFQVGAIAITIPCALLGAFLGTLLGGTSGGPTPPPARPME